MIRCHALQWGHGGRPLTPPLNLQLAGGSLSAIIGGNGCGNDARPGRASSSRTPADDSPATSTSAAMSAGTGADTSSTTPVTGCVNRSRHACSACRANQRARPAIAGSLIRCQPDPP